MTKIFEFRNSKNQKIRISLWNTAFTEKISEDINVKSRGDKLA